MNYKFGGSEKSGHGLFWLLSWHLTGWTEESYAKQHSQSVAGFLPDISQHCVVIIK
jgi:hypothetical protein